MKQQELLEAIKIIAEGVIEKQETQKIIVARIKSDRKENGAYDVEYQDIMLQAFALDSGSVFSINEQVYLLLPKGSLSDTILIMGLVSKTKTATTNIPDLIGDGVITTGHNYILAPTEPVLFIDENSTYPLTIDPLFNIHHNKGQSHLRLRANIYSNISQGILPQFGIRLKIKYLNDASETVFEFSSLRMEGSIYHLEGSVQSRVFDIKIGEPIEYTKGELYLINAQPGTLVKFENLGLELLNTLMNDIISNKQYDIFIESSRGTIFTDEETGETLLKCVVRGNNINIDPDGTLFNYKWFKILINNDGSQIKTEVASGQTLLVPVDSLEGVLHYECEVSQV